MKAIKHPHRAPTTNMVAYPLTPQCDTCRLEVRKLDASSLWDSLKEKETAYVEKRKCKRMYKDHSLTESQLSMSALRRPC